MVGSARKVTIEFLGKDKSLGRTADQAATKTDRLGQKMRMVGKIGAVALAAGVVVAGRALFDMAKGAAADDVASKNLARTMRKTAGASDAQVKATERWITAQGKALGVTDDELRPALGKLVRATKDVDKAQRLAALGMDVAAERGVSLESVSKALAKGQMGQTAGLKKLGVETEDASGKAKSFDQITKDMSKTFGGAASEKANTLEGKMGRLNLMLSETGESIGYKIIPVVEKMATWFLNKAVPAISQFSGEIRAKLGPVIEWIRGLFSSSTGSMAGDVSRNFGAIRSTFESVVSIITSLWSRFGGNLTTIVANTFNVVRGVIGGGLNVIAGIFKVISSVLKGDWRGVWDGIKQILRGAWTTIKAVVTGGWAIVKALFRIGGSALKAIFSGMWSGIKSLAAAGLNGIVSAVRSLPGKLKALGGLLRSAGKGVLTAILNGLKGAGGFAGNFASSIWNAIKSAINGGIDRLNNLLDFKIAIKGAPDIHVNAPNVGHLATGTSNWRGGPSWVGERGPELLDLPPGSKVTSNRKSMKAVNDSGADRRIAIDLLLDGKTMQTILLKLKRDGGVELGLG